MDLIGFGIFQQILNLCISKEDVEDSFCLNDQRRDCEKFSSSIPLKLSFLPRKRVNAAKTSISSVISFKLLHTRFNFSFCSQIISHFLYFASRNYLP